MREWRRNEDAILRVQPEVFDLHRGRAHQYVVAMQHALGLARRSGGEQQLRDRLGIGGCSSSAEASTSIVRSASWRRSHRTELSSYPGAGSA